MKPINLNSIEEKNLGGGDFPQLKPGAYACKVTEVIDHADREYLDVLLDICVGEFEGYFSDKFYADKPWSHSIVLSYKDSALGMLKGRLQTITASNPGFDAEAAWNGGALNMFVGKVVCVVFRAEEYMDKKTGEFKLGSPRPDRLCLMADMADPKNSDPLPKMMKDDEKRQARLKAGLSPVIADSAAPTVDLYAEEVPF